MDVCWWWLHRGERPPHPLGYVFANVSVEVVPYRAWCFCAALVSSVIVTSTVYSHSSLWSVSYRLVVCAVVDPQSVVAIPYNTVLIHSVFHSHSAIGTEHRHLKRARVVVVVVVVVVPRRKVVTRTRTVRLRVQMVRVRMRTRNVVRRG